MHVALKISQDRMHPRGCWEASGSREASGNDELEGKKALLKG